MFRYIGAVVLPVIAIASCNSLPAPPDRPALIASPTPQSTAELRAVLQQALGPREIRIAPDALTRTSILLLEPGVARGSPAGGRLLESPERFELVLSGERCYLIRSGTGDRYALVQADCVAAATDP